MSNVLNFHEASSGIKGDKFKELNCLESLFEITLDKGLKGLFDLEDDIEKLSKSIYNASKLSYRLEFERDLNSKYKAYSVMLATMALKVDGHFINRLELLRGL